MSENTQNQNPKQEQYSLNDDRRVKVLSPGALVAKRFFRNRLAVVGLSILVAMFLFSFVGGLVSPYGQDEQFFTYTQMSKEFVGVTRNDTMRFVVADGQNFGSIAQSKALEAVKKGETEFNYKDVDYTVDILSDDFYVVYQGRDVMGYASRDLVNEADGAPKFSFDAKLAALTAMTAGEETFTADGTEYALDKDGNITAGGEELGYVSRFVVSAADASVVVTRDFKERLEEAIDDNAEKFNYTDTDGNEAEYDIVYDASTKVWSVKQMTETYVYDRYAAPSKEHRYQRYGYADPPDVRRPCVPDYRLHRCHHRGISRHPDGRYLRLLRRLGGQHHYACCRCFLLHSLNAGHHHHRRGDGCHAH